MIAFRPRQFLLACVLAIASSVLILPSTALAQNQPPVADAGPDQRIYTGDSAALNGSAYDPDGHPIVEWIWTMEATPDNAQWTLLDASMPNAVLTASTPGQYLLSLTVGDAQGGLSVPDFVTVTVADNLPPVAIATADKTSGPAPLTVQFNGSPSYDPEGKPLRKYFWDFGDGFDAYGAVPPPHTYTMPGTYTLAILGVTDERGAVGSDVIIITVTQPGNNAPVASPTITPQTGTGPVPLTVQFVANASDPDGDPLTYLWSFGDGTTSKAAKVTHTYYTAATFTVSLTVSDGKDSIVRPLTIVASPINEIDVDKLDIRFKSRQGVLADVKLQSELRAGIPAAAEVIALTIDGDPVFSAPLASFTPEKAAGMPTKYRLKGKDLFVELDFAKRRFTVTGKQVMLPNFDAANGVEVVLKFGATAAVDNVPATDHDGKRHYKFK